MITHTEFMVGIPCWFSGEDSALTVEGLGSIPGRVTKILQVKECGQKNLKKV